MSKSNLKGPCLNEMKTFILTQILILGLPLCALGFITLWDDQTEDEFLELTEKEMLEIRTWASGEIDKLLELTHALATQEAALWREDANSILAEEMNLWRQWASNEITEANPEIVGAIDSLKRPIDNLTTALALAIFFQVIGIITVIASACAVVNSMNKRLPIYLSGAPFGQ